MPETRKPLINKGFQKLARNLLLYSAQQEQERSNHTTRTRRNGSDTTRTTGWRRDKLILLERMCPSRDRPENDKTAPRQRPAPAAQGMISVQSNPFVLRVPAWDLRPRPEPAGNDKNNKRTPQNNNTARSELRGAQAPLVLCGLPTGPVRSPSSRPVLESAPIMPGTFPLPPHPVFLAPC